LGPTYSARLHFFIFLDHKKKTNQYQRRRLKANHSKISGTVEIKMEQVKGKTNCSEDNSETSYASHKFQHGFYHKVKDNLGNEAFVCDESQHQQNNGKKTLSSSMPLPRQTVPVCVRIQAKPEKMTFSNVTTTDDVYQRIQEVIELQSKYRLSTLYKRQWRERSEKNNDMNIDKKKKGVNDEKDENRKSCKGWDGKSSSSTSTFTVAQFNALAEGLSSSSSSPKMPFPPSSKKFPGGEYGGFTSVPHPETSLNFDLRKWRILEVLLGGGISAMNCNDDDNKVKNNSGEITNRQHKNPTKLPLKQQQSPPLPPFDIIAIEEIDHYHNFFQPILSKFFGYDSFFIPKPSSPSTKLGWYSDGCAIFYKKDMFELVSKKEGIYNVGTQVYLILTLRHKESGQVLVVAATHLKAKNDEMNEKIRTAQAIQLYEMVSHIADEVREKTWPIRKKKRGAGDDRSVARNNISAENVNGLMEGNGKPVERDNKKNICQSMTPIIMMGDFNADPTGEGKTCIKSVNSKPHSSPLLPRLCSAYPINSSSMFTTWKTRGANTVKRVIDYIFFHGDLGQAVICRDENVINGTMVDKNGEMKRPYSIVGGNVAMQCTHVLDVPKENEMETELLPGFRYPSDHILIGAKFKMGCFQSSL